MMDQLIQVTSASVVELFETMLMLEVVAGPGMVKPSTVPYVPAPAEISALVELSGGLKGGVRLAMPQALALHLASSLAGESYEVFSEDVRDGFAEICNIIAGGIQSKLESTIGDISLTPPTVTFGENDAVDLENSLESVRHFFSVQGNSFFVEFYFQGKKMDAGEGTDQ
ncbi:MAG: chemotaxis protein CheX [Magnetococcus sp. DMHC-6]